MKTEQGKRAPDRLTAEEMRKLEADAMASGAATGSELMARAGAGVVEAIASRWPDAAPGRAVVLCGPGNNGGDGYVVARRLAAQGWAVEVFALGDPAALNGDARDAHVTWRDAGGNVGALSDAIPALRGADLVIDALFGIGLTRPLSAEVADVLAAVPHTARRVAVDVPSGRETDGGAILGNAAFAADLTVTFHARKPVHDHLTDAGGAVAVVDIGL